MVRRVEGFDSAKSRYTVRLEGRQTVALRPQNCLGKAAKKQHAKPKKKGRTSSSYDVAYVRRRRRRYDYVEEGVYRCSAQYVRVSVGRDVIECELGWCRKCAQRFLECETMKSR